MQTKGHLANHGTIRGHSAGDIYPYVVAIVGNFKDGFKYHLTGMGLKIGDSVHRSYRDAHNAALYLRS